MPMRITLDLPERLPRWATDAGTTVEPGETDKDTGGEVGTRPPARWYNWLFNNIYQWTQIILGLIVGRWDELTAPGSDDYADMLYHPAMGQWLLANTATSPIAYSSPDGIVFSAVETFGATDVIVLNGGGIDTTRMILSVFDNGADAYLYYATLPGNPWSSVTPAGTGTNSPIQRIATKYPDGDFIVIIDGSGNMLHSTAVDGSWTAPSVGGFGSGDAVGLFRTGSISWFLIQDTGDCYTSPDDADNWAATTTITGLSAVSNAAYNETDSRIVAVGTGGAVYSDNLGTTWTQSTINPEEHGAVVYNQNYYLGGGLWIIVCSDNVIMASVDNGITFNPCSTSYDAAESLVVTATDGRKVLAGGGSGAELYTSLAVPGTQA